MSIRPKDLEITVAIAAPSMPNGGIIQYPNISIGSSIVFSESDITSAFMGVTVSPSPCSIECRMNTVNIMVKP